jgi:transposase
VTGLETGGDRIFVLPGPTDMRKQINGLAAVAEQLKGRSAFEGGQFLFCNAERRILKALYWDRTGFCLWMKRLEKHRFPWPRDAKEAREEIDGERLGLLLAGIDFWAAHEKLSYTHIC